MPQCTHGDQRTSGVCLHLPPHWRKHSVAVLPWCIAGLSVSRDSPVSASLATGPLGLHTWATKSCFIWVLKIQTQGIALTQ